MLKIYLGFILMIFPSQLPSHTSKMINKSFAVFVASTDASGNTLGGVAGTAFFISENQAITAFHVLNSSSFSIRSPGQITKIWLLHENEDAIELSAEMLVSSDPFSDSTRIQIKKAIPHRYIFEIHTGELKSGLDVSSEGFYANSAGPVLAFIGGELKVTAIPRLERKNKYGIIKNITNVSLSSIDVNLRNTNCLELSYSPVIGTSGGPVVLNGQVIGMNSFAHPETRASTFAVVVN